MDGRYRQQRMYSPQPGMEVSYLFTDDSGDFMTPG